MQRLSEERPQLRPIGMQCSYGSCPTVYEIDDGTGDIAIQGYVIDHPAPSGEVIVRIPRALLKELES